MPRFYNEILYTSAYLLKQSGMIRFTHSSFSTKILDEFVEFNGKN